MSKITDAWEQLGIIQRQRFEQATSTQTLLLTDAEREALRRLLDDPDLVLGDCRKPLEGLLARCAIGHQ